MSTAPSLPSSLSLHNGTASFRRPPPPITTVVTAPRTSSSSSAPLPSNLRLTQHGPETNRPPQRSTLFRPPLPMRGLTSPIPGCRMSLPFNQILQTVDLGGGLLLFRVHAQKLSIAYTTLQSQRERPFGIFPSLGCPPLLANEKALLFFAKKKKRNPMNLQTTYPSLCLLNYLFNTQLHTQIRLVGTLHGHPDQMHKGLQDTIG
jgi:hypothetical protein